MKVHIEGVCKKYNGVRVLDIKEFDIKDGMLYCILGLNGSGKSTLLNCIAGIEKLYDGFIKYEDNRIFADVRKDISIFMQKPYLFNKSVAENIKLGLKFRNLNGKEINERVYRYMSYFDMEGLLYKNARKLSGGEGARTALLRTAVLETSLTLLDEPTASMDMESTFKAEKLIRNMVSEKRTVLMVTHDLYQAERVADYIIFMDKGKIIESGTKSKVFSKPEHPLVKLLLNM